MRIRLLRIRNGYTAFLVVNVLVLVGVVLVLYHLHVNPLRCDTTSLRRNLARELQQIHLELVGLSTKKKEPSAKLLIRMEEILHRLDSRIQFARPSTHSKESKGQLKLDVCPEVYKGTKYGYPYYAKGWEMTKCTNAPPIKSVITILINAMAYSKDEGNQLNFVLSGIREAYPTVDVYLAVQSKQHAIIKTLKKYRNMKVVQLQYRSPHLGKTWNMLINKASTPYVLIARDMVHFSWLSQLERQIRVVSEMPNVGIAGGSYRNLSGHWKAGCYQSTIRNYVLEYQEGYFHSRNACMFCDYLQGPFVARKSLLKFDEHQSNEVVFEDLFLHLTTSGTLIMGCPDAMYFTSDYSSYPKRSQRQVWLTFAKKWILNRVLLPGGVKHSFSCKDIEFQCNNKLTRSYLLPVCCQEQYAHALAVFHSFSKSHNISFELDTGSVLGTVKFNGLLPWDMDGDLSILSPHLKIFNEDKTIRFFKKHGLILRQYKEPTFDNKTGFSGGYVDVKLPELYIEVWGMPQLTSPQFLPTDLQNRFTLAQVRGSWIPTVFSPGLFSRNRYGAEVLKHSQSWIVTGLKHSFSNYSSGSFLSCDQPERHSCLHDFPADGNIPFLVP